MQTIKKYFNQLTEAQIGQLSVMLSLYPEWNAKVNVISRKDIDNLEVNHILHSLAIARFVQFVPGTRVLDLGTGGGFPAIPLAMMFPDTHFHLVDRIGKKLRVAEDVAQQAGLNNVTLQHGDIKEVKGTFDYVVSRAVMPLPDMVPLVRRLIDRQQRNDAAEHIEQHADGHAAAPLDFRVIKRICRHQRENQEYGQEPLHGSFSVFHGIASLMIHVVLHFDAVNGRCIILYRHRILFFF